MYRINNEIRSACDIKYPTPQFDLIMRAAMLMLDIPPKRKGIHGPTK